MNIDYLDGVLLDNNLRRNYDILTDKIIYMNNSYSVLFTHNFESKYFVFKAHNLSVLINRINIEINKLLVEQGKITDSFVSINRIIDTDSKISLGYKDENVIKSLIYQKYKLADIGVKNIGFTDKLKVLKLNLLRNYSFETSDLNKQTVNYLIDGYKLYHRNGNLSNLATKSFIYEEDLKNIFRMFDKQVKNSFIFLPEYKCFIFKEVNNITDDVNLFYIFCDSKIKLF